MHPELWTIPGIGFHIRAYGFAIAVGFALALWIAVRRAKRVGADPATITSLALIGAIFGIIGCRAMHYLHYAWGALRTGQLGVGEAMTAKGGGEIVGGIVLAVLSAVVYLAVRRKSIGLYLDIVFPPMILAMGIGRIGCLMFGCCWGGVCATPAGAAELPWAIRFPYGSPAYMREWSEGQIKVPAVLLWHPPKAERAFPIPREAFADHDIDGNTALERFVLTAEKANAAHHADPDSAETKRLMEEMKQAAAALGRKVDALEVYAVLHLQDLAARGTPMTWSALRALAAQQHSRYVHPAQLYDAIACTLIFFVLSAIFWRRRHPGMVVAWGMILYGINRPLQEMIRGDNPHDTFGLTISQFMSLTILAGGIVLALVLVRSKRTVPSPAVRSAES
ncbi:MAG TPA: prolipoprotein diacylglyceryl transferase [Phycisphaerae bacterium]|nr:prolipoprotein diacylglyceryl transferase [Phycisphaerae bacterium]